MKRLRWIAAVLCALLMLSLPVMADDGWDFPGVVDPDGTPTVEQPAEPAPEPAPSTEPPQESAGDSSSTANNA